MKSTYLFIACILFSSPLVTHNITASEEWVQDDLIVDAETEEAIEEVLRKMDDDLKEGIVYFSSFLHGIMQMIEGKNNDRQLVLNGIHQSVGSLVEILMIGQKRNQLSAIASAEDLKKLILWLAQAMQQPIAKRALL